LAIVGDWTGKNSERSIHYLVEVLSCYFPRGSAKNKNKKKKLTEKLVINKHLPYTSLMCYHDTNLLGCHIKKHVHQTVVIGIFMNTLICVCNNVFDEWVSDILFGCAESFKKIRLTENAEK
jgi:hypothetical protein